MSSAYYQLHKEQWDMYNHGRLVCQHAKAFREHGMFCPWNPMCMRKDRGKYFECRRR